MDDKKINTCAKDRIEILLSHYAIKAPTFAKKIGVKYQRILDIQGGKTKNITMGLASIIVDSYPELNRSWLLAGEGDMFIGNGDSVKPTEREQRYETRLIPYSATGGALPGVDEGGIKVEQCEIVVSPIAGADWAINIFGDSMYPDYPEGSRIFIKKIDMASFIAWGNVYVLDTINGILVKEVQESERRGCVRCISHNTSGRYKPFDVPVKDIRGMYRILACLICR